MQKQELCHDQKGAFMEFGVVLPHVGPQARERVVERIQTIARQAEALGYHSVWAADHIAMPTNLVSKYPYHPEGKLPMSRIIFWSR
jgi:alkanesulfonate monooxygenase SsuD/methylene tetrahydromethanopterin reductase-like flavin-dependent oxidoreductase (luciferase family)